MGIIPMKAQTSTEDIFNLYILNLILPFVMLLVYILPVGKMIERVVSEKESRARESMKIMGMSDAAYWLSWFLYYTIQVTIISLLGMLILMFYVFPNSDFDMIFLYFWIYGMSLFGFIVFI
jgi:hypothetical protein